MRQWLDTEDSGLVPANSEHFFICIFVSLDKEDLLIEEYSFSQTTLEQVIQSLNKHLNSTIVIVIA